MYRPGKENANADALLHQTYLDAPQQGIWIARLLVEELIPMFGVPEALLSDRGANLLSHLMTDLCALLGIRKLNTTSYYPQCNGMAERFNRTLIGMLRFHAIKFGMQWDKHLPGVLWAYRNTPHDSTCEKPLFLMFELNCRSPAEAAFLSLNAVQPTDLADYREGLVASLTSADHWPPTTYAELERGTRANMTSEFAYPNAE